MSTKTYQELLQAPDFEIVAEINSYLAELEKGHAGSLEKISFTVRAQFLANELVRRAQDRQTRQCCSTRGGSQP